MFEFFFLHLFMFNVNLIKAKLVRNYSEVSGFLGSRVQLPVTKQQIITGRNGDGGKPLSSSASWSVDSTACLFSSA